MILKIQAQSEVLSNDHGIDHGKRLQQRQFVFLGDGRAPLLVGPQNLV